MQDGGVRLLLRKHMPTAQWTAIETGATAAGVPDSEYCFPGGIAGWVEAKRSWAYAVKIRPAQVAWIGRRSRLGGRVHVAIRRTNKSADELYLVPGRDVVVLRDEGLTARDYWPMWVGGPARWDWEAVQKILMDKS